ncbi:MAG: CPBP family intramembrane glutamic endopeptidase [Candidatus Eisenbacteria bacterium]
MTAGFDRRVWAAIAFACLIGTILGLPYGEMLIAHGPAARQAGGPAGRLALQLGLTVFATWPLAAAGLALGGRIGLGAPLLSAWFQGEPVAMRARAALTPAALLGFGLGAGLLAVFAVTRGPLEAHLLLPMPAPPPAWAGVLAAFSAGIQEETLLRLFLMTALAAGVARAVSLPAALWTANVLSALVFGALHFGNVFALGMHLDLAVAAYVLLLNGTVGLLCGWLYARHGIEAAMVAHTACDLVLHGLGATLGGGR